MRLDKLFKIQQELDERIIKEKGLTPGQHLTDQKIIAFKVELGELLNEIRAFKFWSNKKSSEKSIILEELVDGIHFLLSIANDRKYTYINSLKAYELADGSINSLSFDLFNNRLSCSSDWAIAFCSMLAIGEKMGFSENEIERAYLMKNKKNHERQDNHY